MFSILAIAQTLVPLITLGRQNLPDLECWANQSDGQDNRLPRLFIAIIFGGSSFSQSVSWLAAAPVEAPSACRVALCIQLAIIPIIAIHSRQRGSTKREAERRLALFA